MDPARPCHAATRHPRAQAPAVLPAPPGRPRPTAPGQWPRRRVVTGPGTRLASEAGSVATEYGLLAVVAATIVAVVLEWATSGGISGLLDAVVGRVGDIVGL